jgi:hypothetical protein
MEKYFKKNQHFKTIINITYIIFACVYINFYDIILTKLIKIYGSVTNVIVYPKLIGFGRSDSASKQTLK